MIIIWKDPNMKLHGKRHKRDRYYFRWHYGKQRVVQMTCAYVDRPTERQKSAREAFTELRREVARQLRDERLRAEWLRRFEADNEGYKMLHTYVYAMIRREAGTTETTETSETTMRRGNALVSTGETTERRNTITSLPRGEETVFILYNGVIMPLFLPNNVPKQECVRVLQI